MTIHTGGLANKKCSYHCTKTCDGLKALKVFIAMIRRLNSSTPSLVPRPIPFSILQFVLAIIDDESQCKGWNAHMGCYLQVMYSTALASVLTGGTLWQEWISLIPRSAPGRAAKNEESLYWENVIHMLHARWTRGGRMGQGPQSTEQVLDQFTVCSTPLDHV